MEKSTLRQNVEMANLDEEERDSQGRGGVPQASAEREQGGPRGWRALTRVRPASPATLTPLLFSQEGDQWGP